MLVSEPRGFGHILLIKRDITIFLMSSISFIHHLRMKQFTVLVPSVLSVDQ